MKRKSKIIYMVFLFCGTCVLASPGLSAMDKSGDESNVNIAVAAESSTESSRISDKAGRAPYFLIFNGSGVFVKAIKNPSQYEQGGASSRVTALLKKESVKTFIAVNFGTKMENNLKAAGIEYREHTGIAKEVVETITKNRPSKNAHN